MDAYLPYLLTMLGHLLPQLLATIAVLVLLWSWAPVAPGRAHALAGASIMVAACVLRGIAAGIQAWLTFGTASAMALMPLLAGVNILFSVMEAVGVVLLGWGAVKAMQAARGVA
ncbi:hypothetical protein [Xanthomonas sp. XNM01]|uniref:hypothetical protein n=1 Tax=Xanthomonas sp. XNM01 TaxID=2769289 RepID=UPI001782BC02|nr:hypothetical protein [Xanthomonas sp. XNM01]MBD9368489.1 hypothetical protein [Xanthomonas sp. XNM01]